MQFFARLYHKDEDINGVKCELNEIAEFIKKHPEDSYRAAYYSSEKDESLLYGPMIITFAIRRAKDLLLEPCEYADTKITLEAMGRRIAQLPGVEELKKLLASEDCLIDINSRQYKPLTEVYGFGQVYDDSVRCLEALKNLKINHESIMVFATPEEISLEIHPKALGLEGCKDLEKQYSKLLSYVCEIKTINSRPQKTSIKTVLLDSCENKKIILPGAVESRLHRAKVNVGASHFAYGPAAFSDFCGKKRSIEECVQETLNWVKFITKPVQPVEGLAKKISEMPLLLSQSQPTQGAALKSTDKQGSMAVSGLFQPLKKEIDAIIAEFSKPQKRIKAFSAELNKLLGGGYAPNTLNLIVGPRNSGKSSFLLAQAMLAQSSMPVLYMSFERSISEFTICLAAAEAHISCPELLVQINQGTPLNERALRVLEQAANKLKAKITSNLFFAPIDCAKNTFSVDDVVARALMMPEAENRLVIIEKAPAQLLLADEQAKLKQLCAAAHENNLIIIVSAEHEIALAKRPLFADEADRAVLDLYLPFADTITTACAERSNLRRFAALLKGSIDVQTVEALEQKANELAGKKRLKSDTYAFFRLLKNNRGKRGLLLYLFQPDIFRLVEMALLPISLP